jgi:hypothetical protein
MEGKTELVLLHAGSLRHGDTYEEFHCLYPRKPMPQQVTVSKLKKQFHVTGSVADKKRSGHSYSRTDHDHMVMC